ncbi:kanadaptin [Anabrus simplex]|uniref:kanadaptin n=1 Tax=Anabrus simplex TaxID=316456 RepID=UPI0035A26A46
MSVSSVNQVNIIEKDMGFEEDKTAVQPVEDLGSTNKSEVFKKPLLFVGPRKGKVVGKIRAVNRPSDDSQGDSDSVPDSSDYIKTEEREEDTVPETKQQNKLSPAQKLKDIAVPLPYKEPNWGGIPEEHYAFEVLKSGSILENIDLSSKSFYVFGRLSTCDVRMAHPTVSRFHAVLQYKNVESEDKPTGYYIYDLGSTHGTFLNKHQIKPNLYVRVHVGHMLRFGGSTRMFILQGPEKDMEKESELTVTQLKEKQLQKKAQELNIGANAEHSSEDEDKGIDWGMGEDADEETDLAENPFASTQNEELFITDPKKTLRGWFEREGYELEYDVEEKGFGQFLCRVELPIEAARGGTLVAEALVKGKKKESVVQCALEACRILDRYGLLRQANHESKKRKAKNWEEEDFYDSDEDTFLDRTGAVEKKRMQRMQAAGKIETQTETYDSLLKKHSDIVSELQEVESQLQNISSKINSSTAATEGDEVDALDAFMTNLSSEVPDKKLLVKLKSQLASLRQEEARLRKLVNIARPASLPELAKPKELPPVSRPVVAAKTGPMKRKATSFKPQPSELVGRSSPKSEVSAADIEEEEEEEEEEEGNEEDKNKNNDGKSISVNEVSLSGSVCDSDFQDGPAKKEALSCSENEREERVPSPDKSSLVVKENHNIAPKIIGPSLPPTGIDSNSEPSEKRRKRNRGKASRIKAESEKNFVDDYDASDPAYSMWVPPEDQSGDGRTKLNDKYGY